MNTQNNQISKVEEQCVIQQLQVFPGTDEEKLILIKQKIAELQRLNYRQEKALKEQQRVVDENKQKIRELQQLQHLHELNMQQRSFVSQQQQRIVKASKALMQSVFKHTANF